MRNSKAILLGILLLFCMRSVFGLALLEKLDQAAELNKLTDTQRMEGRYQLILMLIHCEFSETCLLHMIDDLKEIEKKNHNPMFVVYLHYLQAKKSELIEQEQRCQIPEKQVVRKAIAGCLKEMIVKEVNAKKLDRNMIDKLQDERDQCLKGKMEELAKTGNLFAQAMLVNAFEQTREGPKLDYWYNEMQKKADTKEYKTYLTCPDIP